MFRKRDGFIVLALVLVSVLAITFSNFDINLAPPTYSRCITPPAYPQLINQSGTICPGNYKYGIGLGANNLKIDCRSGTTFRGVSWNGTNGLTIKGVRNVSVEGCTFTNFTESGVFVGNASNYTAEVKLKNITSSSNNGDGIFVGHNVVNFYLDDSEVRSNMQDGVVFRANHFGQINSSSNVFPRGVYLKNNQIVNNYQNGIKLDAFDYWGYLFANYSNPYGNIYTYLNNYVEIINNNISNNYRNGIQNIGFTAHPLAGLYMPGSYSYVISNTINSNGAYLNGSGIDIISSQSDLILNHTFGTSNISGTSAEIDYIVSNDLIANRLDGVSSKSIASNNILHNNPIYGAGIAQLVYTNYITHNGRYGISSIADDRASFSTGVAAYQNVVSNNSLEGIKFIGYDNSSLYKEVYLDIKCNDIISNGAGNSNGIQISKFNTSSIIISAQNIIEANKIGILIENILSLFPAGHLITENYIGFNDIGLKFNQTNNIFYVGLGLGYNSSNDFDQNNLQAFDAGLNSFTHNWWSDYSPGCIDSSPANGFCDVPRSIPIANQDVEPKAGTWWGHKNRGYFVRANPGVVEKPSCGTGQGLPGSINITIPDQGQGTGTGSIEPIEPGIGTGGTTTGTTSGTGGFVKGK